MDIAPRDTAATDAAGAADMRIADKRIATVHFTLSGEDGNTITTTRGHAPLVYMHGQGSIVAGLEEALAGRASGECFEVTIAPEAGFGQRHAGLVQVLPRSMWRAPKAPEVGDRLETQTGRGPLEVVVTAVDAESVTVDGNHPLAGRAFRAEVEVVSVRVPTPDEALYGLG